MWKVLKLFQKSYEISECTEKWKKNEEKCYGINKFVWIGRYSLCDYKLLCVDEKKTISRVITFFLSSSFKLVGEGVVGFYYRCRSCLIQKSFAIHKYVAPNAFTHYHPCAQLNLIVLCDHPRVPFYDLSMAHPVNVHACENLHDNACLCWVHRESILYGRVITCVVLFVAHHIHNLKSHVAI